MISLEAIFSSLIIYAHEGREVYNFDTPGAYLHTDIPKDKQILLKLRNNSVDIMCDVNEEHKKNMVIENKKRVLYINIVRAIYGCIKSALMCYDLYYNTYH